MTTDPQYPVPDPPPGSPPDPVSRSVPGPEPAPPKPPPETWGLWPSLVWGVIIVGVSQVVQAFVVAGFLLARWEDEADPMALLNSLATDGTVISIAALLGCLVVLPLTAGIIWLRRGWPVSRYLALGTPRWLPALPWAAACLAFPFVYGWVFEWLSLPTTPDWVAEVGRNPGSWPLLFLGIAVAAPLLEEVLFRGFLLTGLARTALGPVGAALLTSLAWTALHVQYNLPDLISIFLLGLILAGARLASRSLWVPIVLHAVINGWAVAELYLNPG